MPENERIITTMAIQENPRIAESGTTEIGTFSIKQRNTDLNRYWKNVDESEKRRKLFPIEYWKLDKLFQKTGQVALVVRKINDPFEVRAKWVSFSPDNPPELGRNSRCYVLSEDFYNGLVTVLNFPTVSHFINGIETVSTLYMSSNFLVALLGKDPQGQYTLYLQNASASLIEEDPKGAETFGTSPGGEGTGGVKLPMG